jgi:PEP-CTERM motif
MTGDTASHAFLYVGTPGSGGVMTDLDVWLDANNPTEGAKWTLFEARGLNDTGLITGFASYNDGPGGLTDGSRAFRLDASSLIPEPGSLSLLAVGGLALLRRARRHRSRSRS